MRGIDAVAAFIAVGLHLCDGRLDEAASAFPHTLCSFIYIIIFIFNNIILWGVSPVCAFRLRVPCARSVCAFRLREIEVAYMQESELVFGEEVLVADDPVELVSSDIAAAKIDDQTERQPGTGLHLDQIS